VLTIASRSSERIPRVLVVDDNVDSTDILSQLLSQRGYAVKSAADGPGALQVIAGWTPDVALLNIARPGMSGFDLADCLRLMPAYATLPLVALTGFSDMERRRRSTELGFAAYLTKPIDLLSLLQLLAELTADATST
jgi:CheY-like chemotaxis protein